MNPAMPNSLITVLELAAILILLIATVGAFLSVFITKRSGLVHLGLQLSMLLFMLYISRNWVYPLIFTDIRQSLAVFPNDRGAMHLVVSLRYQHDIEDICLGGTTMPS